MKEILFKGIRKDNGKWVEGYYVYTSGDNKHWILKLGEFKFEVIPETVSQYTGRCDKNGKKIFEGDKLSNGTERLCKIIWFEHQACFDATPLNSKGTANLYEPNNWDRCEVVGNVHDNPKL